MKVLDVDKNWVFIAGNGDIKKVPKCNVQLNMKNCDDCNYSFICQNTAVVRNHCIEDKG